MSADNTKAKILNSAEYLFAHQGYHNTSLREITRRARVNLAAVNYHFSSKEKLLEAVIERRLTPLNKERAQRLEEVLHTARENKKPPGIEPILRAFIEPVLCHIDTSPEKNTFIATIIRVHTDPDNTIRSHFLEQVTPIAERFFEALCQAQPDLPKETVFNRFLLVIGAMGFTVWTVVMNPEHIPLLDTKHLSETGRKAFSEQLITFASKGMMGP